jgi:protein dithiol:quinone oxidoreductase
VSNFFTNPRRVFALAFVACAGAVGAALVSQHVYDMQPCPWCILQRLIFAVIGIVALIGLLFRSRAGQMGTAVVMDLLASGGIAAALWQHFVAAASASCNLTLADRIINGLGVDGAMPEVFAPRASCADSAVTMFGVPYEFWSLAAFAMLGGLAVLVILGRPRAD